MNMSCVTQHSFDMNEKDGSVAGKLLLLLSTCPNLHGSRIQLVLNMGKAWDSLQNTWQKRELTERCQAAVKLVPKTGVWFAVSVYHQVFRYHIMVGNCDTCDMHDAIVFKIYTQLRSASAE